MPESDASPAEPRSTGPRSPSSMAEFVDILLLRRPVLVGVAVGVAVLGAVVSVVAPGLLPPRPLAGAAVGLAACLLAVAAAVAVDAADRVVRGPRHVRATGAVHVATVGPRGQGDLVAWMEHRLHTEGSMRVAIAGAGVDPLRSGMLTADLGRNLARRGWRVLLVDLHEQDGDDGISEVTRGSHRLSEVVDYHPTLDLAEVGPGRDLAEALDGFPALASRLPRDVDALLVALPGVQHQGVLPAVAAIDGILLLAEVGTTTRVELIAALDALDEARVPSEVVLLSSGTVSAPAPPAAPAEPGPRDEVEQPDEPVSETRPETTVDPEVDRDAVRDEEPAAPPPGGDAADVLAELRAEDTAEMPPAAPTPDDAGASVPQPEPEPEPAPPPEPESEVESEPESETPSAAQPDPLDRTPYAADRWSDRDADTAPTADDGTDRDDLERDDALRLTATLENLANEIWTREGDAEDR